MTSEEAQAVRAAEHQSLFREVNERIEDLNETFATFTPMGDWICECANERCFETMSLTVSEYEAIRAHPARFPVLPGHELPEVETVVETHERYLVVEKLGAARDTAIAHDPRSASTGTPAPPRPLLSPPEPGRSPSLSAVLVIPTPGQPPTSRGRRSSPSDAAR